MNSGEPFKKGHIKGNRFTSSYMSSKVFFTSANETKDFIIMHIIIQ